MENFKFDLTDEQVRLLHEVLEDSFCRACHVAWVKHEVSGNNDCFRSYLLGLSTLIDELYLQKDKYLNSVGRDSFLHSDDSHKF